jgi:MFS family permease
MFWKDPLSPVWAYFRNYVVTGLGLFVEGYTLFSVGNLTPLYSAVWPECWKTHDVCDEQWVHAVDYLSIVGIIVGQILVGIEGDWIGRRFGMVQNALIMTLGSVMLAAMWGTSLNGWVICYGWSLFVYGLGVGGEYPMTSTRSMEGATGRAAREADRRHRGRKVSLAFLMQGWGQFANQVVLILLLLIFHGSGDPPYGTTSTQWVFRVQFGIIAFITLFLAYLRFYKMKYQDNVLRDSKKRLNTSGYDFKSLNLATGHYWHRLIGTAGAWFCNDFFFYGNKIFAGVFISIITGGSSTLITSWLYNLINIGVSLVGYYLAALLMDYKMYGRKWMQATGFVADFILFIIAAALYGQLTQPGEGVHWFQFIYFFSSFWNQFGPNSTTFLLAAEVYPTSIRATAHGVSAAVGKLGALAPAILYNYIDNHTKFWVVTWFGLAGMILTVLFVPDTTGLDLPEQDRYWQFVRQGRQSDYHGVAVHPRHLSLWERLVLRRHRAYDPELDRQQKLDEIGKEMQNAAAPGDSSASPDPMDNDDEGVESFLDSDLAL